MRALLPLVLFSSQALASFPENNLHVEDNFLAFDASMTEQTFRTTINEVINIYRPIVQRKGAQLAVEYNWNDSTVNAYAQKGFGVWTVSMFGGLARRPEITRDGFSLVVCHEVGHLLGAFPFYSGEDVATEGQADYWATQACAKRLWGASFNSRYLAASQSISNMLAATAGERFPNVNTKDRSVVRVTQESHPRAQCRLDTYLAGAACSKAFPITSYPLTQAQAFLASCAKSQLGARPACWFFQK